MTVDEARALFDAAPGPLAGLAEISLPALQPGSSIMPAKVNPVVPEAVAMAATQVIAHDAAVGMAGASGSFQLNVMMPLIAHALDESIALARSSDVPVPGAPSPISPAFFSSASAASEKRMRCLMRAGTSRIVSRPVRSIARRSIPSPSPPVGGIPYESAST